MQATRKTAFSSAAMVALLAIGAAACGDDDNDAAPTTAEFCLELQKLDDGDDSGPYDEFYAKHPEPTPADWAADGYLVTDAIQEGIDEIKAMNPSAEMKALIADALAAFEVLKQNSIDVSEAGKNGDQSAIDELEQVNQNENVPALMAAFEAVGAFCESAAGS